MTDSDFLKHKRWFFSQGKEHPQYASLPNRESSLTMNTRDSEGNEMIELQEFPILRSLEVDYRFLLKHHQALETELGKMFAVLQKQRKDSPENNEVFWYYCSYCASLLETFYTIYSQQEKAKQYKKIREQIRNHLNHTNDAFIETLESSLTEGFRNLLQAPLHAAKIREYIDYSDLCCGYWGACQLAFTQGLAIAKDFKPFTTLYDFLNQHLDNSKVIEGLQAPNAVMGYFSLGFFLIRFIIEGALLLKHTFYSQEEKKGVSKLERFQYEWNKRYSDLANSSLQFVINFITIFNKMTHISSQIAGDIISIFIFFNVCRILYSRHEEEQKYLSKKEEYEHEIKRLIDVQRMNEERGETSFNEIQQIQMLKLQLNEHDLNWKVKQAHFDFLAVATALLLIGFTCSMIATPGLALFACYFIGTLARAMYFSIDSYSKLEEKRLNLAQTKNQVPADSLDKEEQKRNLVLEKEYHAACENFIFTMIKKTTIPMLLITTFSLCWPAAVVLTVMYLGFELHSYKQTDEKKFLQQASDFEEGKDEGEGEEEIEHPMQ